MIRFCLIGGLVSASLLATDIVEAQTETSQSVTDSNLRDLLRAASEDGWVEFVPDITAPSLTVQSINNVIETNTAECEKFVGIDPNGFFDENPITGENLNALLPKLLEGEELSDDELTHFTGLADCGPEFETWAHLAISQKNATAVNVEIAISGLYHQTPYIRERAGLSLAISAGLAGNRASLRRFADMLEDAGLHGTLDLERDPRHILLDALLLENNDFEGARQRYEWLSESDGPEQIFALDRLTALGASVLAAETLERIGQDLSRDDHSQLTDLKLKAALRSSTLATISELIQSDPINVQDISEDHFAEIIQRTRVALSGEDINEKILALDIYNRFEANFENEELEPLAKSALVSVLGKTSEKTTTESDNEATYFANRPALVRQTLSSDTAKNFISDISKDLIEAEKILSNG